MSLPKVIIVDDHKTYRVTLKNILRMATSCQIVAEASSGQEYLDLLKKHKPDITFMDVAMPNMTGIEATKKALEIHKDLTIIGLSFYDDDAYIEQLIEAGARGYILKMGNNIEMFKTIIENPKAEIFYSERIKKRKFTKGTRRKNILIVDDFETNTIVVASALKSAGYNVLRATSAGEAMKMAFNESELDLIIADYNMPVKNGVQMIREIKNFPGFENIPSLILSSDTDKAKKDEARKVGAQGWVKKPFQLAKFLEIIDSVIKK